MQICARHQWRHAKVKSNGSGSNVLTPDTCLCYRFCALWAWHLKRRTHGAKQSARPCGPLLLKIAPREMKHALKMHVPVCLYTYCIVFVYCDYTMYTTVRYSYKCSLQNTFQVLLFIQVLSFVTPVHITQTATRLVEITHCIHEINIKISLP